MTERNTPLEPGCEAGPPFRVQRAPGNGPGGFSMIELLVVCAVIAMLASLMIGALSLVREKANAAKCVGNLKQLGIATILFAKENNDQIPYANYYAEANTRWYTKLVPYLNVRLPDEEQIPPDPYRCAACSYPAYKGNRTHFGKNYEINSDPYVDQTPRRTGYRFSSIESPSQYYYLADSAANSSGYANRELGSHVKDSPNAKRGIEARHRGMANILFLDMHVEPVALKDIPDVVYGMPPWSPRSE